VSARVDLGLEAPRGQEAPLDADAVGAAHQVARVARRDAPARFPAALSACSVLPEVVVLEIEQEEATHEVERGSSR
jgi:hypothetical protein